MTMPKRSSGPFRWLLLAGLLCCSSCQSVPSFFENKTGQNFSRPRVFSPRMDYDEWTPLGRGDPLKNNPTFDYVPPVLDRVQYWLDSHTTEPSSKRDILVLGVTAKKTSPKIPEHFLHFVDGPKFTRTGQDTSYRNDFTGSGGAEPPKIVRTTSFRNGLIDYRNQQNRLQSPPASYYPSPYYNQKKPYTMMMPPPPMIQKAETSTSYNAGVSKDKVVGYGDASQSFGTQTEEGPLLQDAQYHGAPSKDYGHYSSAASSRPYSTSKTLPSKVSQVDIIKNVYVPTASQSTRSRYEATTAPSVSFEKSNLIYQSTQTVSGGWLGNNGPTSSSSTGFPDANQVTWQTPDYTKDHYETDYHPAASSNHEVVVGQNANIIVDGNNNENEEVVVGHKEAGSSTEATSSTSESVAQTSTVSSTTIMDSTEPEEEQRETEEAATEAQTSQKMHIVLANSPSATTNLETHKAKKGPVAVVMPTNYIEKNSSSDPPTTFHNALGNPLTSEMTKTTYQAPKAQPQPTRNAVTSSPIVDTRPYGISVPNKMIPPSQLPHQPPPPPPPPPHPPSAPITPARHVGGLLHMSPQTASQSRPNHAMHFIGSMHPGLRPSSPMSHMSPPMAHMHAPPIKTMMGPSPNMGQTHQRPPQPFPVTFTNPPSPPTMNMQATESEQSNDYRPSRLLTTIINSMTTSVPFTPTVSSTVEYASTAGTDHQESTRPNQTPLVKILSTEETSRTSSTIAPSSTNYSPRTTTVPSLTTDPIFSHYKQPNKPISGPMYHIIQGHSKVKTYGPAKKYTLPIENNEIAQSITERQLSKMDKLEQLIWQNTKNGGVDPATEKRKLEEKARAEKRVPLPQRDSLTSLVESGLEGFTVEPSSSTVTETERRANSVTSIEIN